MDYEPVKSVIRTCYHVLAVYSKEFQETGYSFTETYVLATIGRHPGIIANQITEYIDVNKGYLSRVIKRLTQDGLVFADNTASRQNTKPLYLSDAGKALFDEMEEKADESIARHIADAAPEDKAAFFQLMKALDKNFSLVYPDSLA